ncbi:GntP family permease [Caproiciproducens sp. NJN-50]|uniref:GntP family permease n=1 Tax=Caproiciproducens sp. NJN-50 TaxID=2507162 RepID=UPI000FFDFB21|nr:GntP family permease [Caproiciproducens sp. NJN-50]QAT48973.1 GntP family permease [Caproiciproducens sp. NJN-50]
MTAFGIIGIILAFALLMYMIMKGFNIYLTVFCCTLVVALTSRMNVYDAYKDYFMTGFTTFFKNYYLIFLTGTLMAKAMEITGGAKSIAKFIIKIMGTEWAFVSVPLACGVLCYGGVSAFVCSFCVFPIALQVFHAADLPRNYIPGALCFGCSTFAMIAPGAVQIHNAVPSTILGTSFMAGAVNGFISCGFMLVAGIALLRIWLQKAKTRGEHFLAKEGDEINEDPNENLPNPVVALIPLVITIFLVNFKINGVNIAKVETGVLGGAVSAVLLMWKFINAKELPKHFADGAAMALFAITNTCAVNGFGGVATNSPVFSIITNAMVNIPGPKLLGLVVGTTVIAGICGSASGGLGIAVPILGPVYVAQGISAATVHRIMALASSALDSLPHNGYIVTVTNGLCHETHRDSYPLTFWLTVVIPLLGSLVGVVLFTLFPNLP